VRFPVELRNHVAPPDFVGVFSEKGREGNAVTAKKTTKQHSLVIEQDRAVRLLLRFRIVMLCHSGYAV
jgi:hypothetical protein